MYKILRLSTVGLRPTQHFVHEAGHPIEFSNFVAASIWIAKLKQDLPEPLRRRVRFQVVPPTRH